MEILDKGKKGDFEKDLYTPKLPDKISNEELGILEKRFEEYANLYSDDSPSHVVNYRNGRKALTLREFMEMDKAYFQKHGVYMPGDTTCIITSSQLEKYQNLDTPLGKIPEELIGRICTVGSDSILVSSGACTEGTRIINGAIVWDEDQSVPYSKTCHGD